jgi:hypothetical protein
MKAKFEGALVDSTFLESEEDAFGALETSLPRLHPGTTIEAKARAAITNNRFMKVISKP